LNFRGNANGGDIVVLSGTAEVDESAPSAAENAAWVAKYATEWERAGWQPSPSRSASASRCGFASAPSTDSEGCSAHTARLVSIPNGHRDDTTSRIQAAPILFTLQDVRSRFSSGPSTWRGASGRGCATWASEASGTRSARGVAVEQGSSHAEPACVSVGRVPDLDQPESRRLPSHFPRINEQG
jgi:hypothetical protein